LLGLCVSTEVKVAISKAVKARDGGRRTVATRDENNYVSAIDDFNFGRFGPAVLAPNFFNRCGTHAALLNFGTLFAEEVIAGIAEEHAGDGIR
jgi:hypothetical protein